MSTERSQKSFRKLILASLILLYLSMSLGFFADLLYWWQRVDPNVYLVGPVIVLVLFPTFTWLPFSLLWHALLKRTRASPASGWMRVALTLCLTLNLLAALLLTLTTFGSIRSVQSQQTRLTGYLVPGGRASLAMEPRLDSVNNHYQGDLMVSWKAASSDVVATDYFEPSGGTSTEHDMAYTNTIMRQMIPLPQEFSQGLRLEWSVDGTVMVFANPEVTNVHAGGPGGTITRVNVDDVEFSASGSLKIGSLPYPPWLERLLIYKENNRLALWLAGFVLLLINCAVLTGARLNEGFNFNKPADESQVGKPPLHGGG